MLGCALLIQLKPMPKELGSSFRTSADYQNMGIFIPTYHSWRPKSVKDIELGGEPLA